MVADISYTAHASEVGRRIKANPDALMHASYITDAIRFTKTFKAMGFNPKDKLRSHPTMSHCSKMLIPSGLKPALFAALGGTAKAVPFRKPFMRRLLTSRFLPPAWERWDDGR